MNSVALEQTEKWIKEKLIPLSESGQSFDVGKEMISITLDALCKTAFEYDISDKEKLFFVSNCELVFREFLTKSFNNPFRKYIGSWIPDRKRALQAASDNTILAKRIIEQYRKNPNPLEGTIIDHLCKNPCYANDDELAADVLLYLIAGHDVSLPCICSTTKRIRNVVLFSSQLTNKSTNSHTFFCVFSTLVLTTKTYIIQTTAYTLAFTLLQLSRNPEEQNKVRNDIANMTTAVEWRKSDVLQRSIKESMRLYPVSSSGSSRVCGRDFITKEGWMIPKGTTVVSHIMMTHRNKNVYGDDADAYIPSRWINPTQAQKDSFLIYSAGKQNCVGQALANAELQCIIPKILSEVELEVVDEGRITWFLTLKPIGATLRAKRVIR